MQRIKNEVPELFKLLKRSHNKITIQYSAPTHSYPDNQYYNEGQAFFTEACSLHDQITNGDHISSSSNCGIRCLFDKAVRFLPKEDQDGVKLFANEYHCERYPHSHSSPTEALSNFV